MKRVSICACSICATVAVLTTTAWGTDAPPRPSASPSPGVFGSRPSATPAPAAPSSPGTAEPAFAVKMPLVCTVAKGGTVRGKPSSVAVVRPQYLWEPTPKAIRVTVNARHLEKHALPPGVPTVVVTKTQIFNPARVRWSPNQSLSIDLETEYPPPLTGAMFGKEISIPSNPKCDATYEVARHIQP